MTEKQFLVKPEASVISYLRHGKSLQFISRTQSFARDYYICAGARVMDFSGSVDLDKIMMLMEVEMQMIDPGDDVIIVGAKNSL